MSFISPLETKELLASEQLFACIDVRERGEFAGDQIAGTTPVSRGALEYRVPVMIPSQVIPVVVCCDDGRRSELAAATLARMAHWASPGAIWSAIWRGKSTS